MSQDILLDVKDNVATITLNRPDSLNAIGAAAAELWRAYATDVTSRGDIKLIVITGSGKAFCAGGDIREMATGSSAGDGVTELAEVINEGMLALEASPHPILAVINGAVAGGGLGFMLSADYIIASETSTFQSRYANIGLTPDCGVTTLLTQAVGIRNALRFVLTDTRLTASDAVEWGLITESVSPARLAERTEALVEHWRSGATGAYGQARRLLRAALRRSYIESLHDEAVTIGRAIETPEAKVRISGFVAEGARRS